MRDAAPTDPATTGSSAGTGRSASGTGSGDTGDGGSGPSGTGVSGARASGTDPSDAGASASRPVDALSSDSLALDADTTYPDPGMSVLSHADTVGSGTAGFVSPGTGDAFTLDIASIAPALLDWYDRHARTMPWRTSPADRARGVRPDPYRVWLSEVMLQQTTVAAVRAYFQRFTARWPTVADLAAAADADVMAAWAGLGYYARARNLLKCARAVVSDHGGRFPDNRAALLTLPGIGPYTASALAAIAFDEAATVVDGNVERVVARLHDIDTPLPAAKAPLTALADRLTPPRRPGDYAQAVMDLGATICTPRNPACGICPLRAPCLGRQRGTAPDLPRKTPKAAKPVRHGVAYVARAATGHVLLETRPPKGLLGGMLGWPTTGWTTEAPDTAPPFLADWHDTGAEARHTFTHFHLILQIVTVTVPEPIPANRGDWIDGAVFSPAALPTLMRKVHDLA